MEDTLLTNKIKSLHELVVSWAMKHDLGEDYAFESYMEHFNDEPNENAAVITVLLIDGSFYDLFNGNLDDDLMDEFEELIKKHGFSYEKYNHYTLEFYVEDEALNQQYLNYFEWQWICKLIEPNYTSLYNELYEYFAKNPDRLYNIHDRKFEILISEIFKNQGYYTELGPGRSDKGVDVRLYQKDEIDQIVTLVQLKKYKKALPIKLEAVAALKAIVDQENANRGLFITTSRFLPVAKKFAEREKSKLILADSNDVARWCNNVNTSIVRDKSKVIDDEYLASLVNSKSDFSLVGRIVVADVGYGMIANEFCIILKDSFKVVLLMRLPAEKFECFDPPYNTRGSEIPILDKRMLAYKNKDNVFRAEKIFNDNGEIKFNGKKRFYHLWDNQPKYFDWND